MLCHFFYSQLSHFIFHRTQPFFLFFSKKHYICNKLNLFGKEISFLFIVIKLTFIFLLYLLICHNKIFITSFTLFVFSQFSLHYRYLFQIWNVPCLEVKIYVQKNDLFLHWMNLFREEDSKRKEIVKINSLPVTIILSFYNLKKYKLRRFKRGQFITEKVSKGSFFAFIMQDQFTVSKNLTDQIDVFKNN